MKRKLLSGVVHTVPADLRKIISSSKELLEAWNSITPLARNEWICWIEDAKREDTRKRRIDRTHVDLTKGKRRPCCWPGCKHR